jgi:hypothetical protein
MEDQLCINQLESRNEFRFVPESDLEFFIKNGLSYHIMRFIKDKDGVIVQVVFFEREILNKILD